MSGNKATVDHAHSRGWIRQSRHNHHDFCIRDDDFFALLIWRVLERAAQDTVAIICGNDSREGVDAAAQIPGHANPVSHDDASLLELAGQDGAEVEVLVTNEVTAAVNANHLPDWFSSPIGSDLGSRS